ncbi:MAG: hypothetical protein ACTSWY_15910 [Promethearchaeota archaeon]
MNRILMEEILKKMKSGLKRGDNIGNFKVGALFALGSQLEALFYFVGHELGSKFETKQIKEINGIVDNLKQISSEYHLGEIIIKEKADDHITFILKECGSCKDFPETFKSEGTFCSFEAGLFAGIVEKITSKHVFAQELACKLQKGVENCQFIIVLPEEE